MENRQPQAEPFLNEAEYLDTLFQYETARLQAYLDEELRIESRGRLSHNRYLPDARTAGSILEKKLEDGNPRNIFSDMNDWEEYIEERRQASADRGLYFGLDGSLYLAGLGLFGRSVAVQTLMAALDRDYQEVYRYLNGDVERPYPTLSLCAAMYYGSETESSLLQNLAASGELPGICLLYPAVAAAKNPFQEQLVADSVLIQCLTGMNTGSRPWLRRTPAEDAVPGEALLFRQELCERLKGLIGSCLPEDGITPEPEESRGLVLVLKGDAGAGKKSMAQAAAAAAGLGITYFSTEEYRENPGPPLDELLYRLRVCLRGAALEGDLLAVEGLDYLESRTARLLEEALKREALRWIPAVLVLAEKEDYAPADHSIMVLAVPPLDPGQRKVFWHAAAKDLPFGEDPDEILGAAANTFDLTPGQILAAARMALRSSAAADAPVSMDFLFEACYAQTDHGLRKKADRVTSRFTMEDIKLPAEDKQILGEICYRVRHKDQVMSQWGFSDKVPYGAGTPVVFAGPPGTGKTMAAQVLANELHMVMYRIDVSQLVDKYIGETEKNIRMVFAQAKKSGCILFFDEADAIFGKRVEAKSSNDRFANIESSLLLQCVEEYDGISILATNNLTAMDPAFMRRFKYVIRFRSPDSTLRTEIWKSVFPAGAPVGQDVDFAWLGESFELSGAQIKNAALAAAFLAAAEGTSIGLLHILKGVRKEWQKEGRELTARDLGSFGYYFSQL